MFVGPDQYQDCIRSMVASEDRLDVAVAFWGRGAEELIHPKRDKPLRIVCNLRSGGTNPAVIKKLVARAKKIENVQILQCDRLHAKVIVGPSQAIIGSANLSANGLGFEGSELSKWLEAAIHTTEESEVGSAQKWFEQLWSSRDTREITDQDLVDAAEAYKKNRNGRPDYGKKGPFSFTNYSTSDLEGRDAFALLYTSRPGPEADARKDQHDKQEHLEHANTASDGEGTERWAFETWPDSLDTTGKNEYLCVFWDDRKRLRVDGACRMTDTKLKFIYEEDGSDGWVDLAKPAATLLGRRLTTGDCRRLTTEIRPRFEAIWNASEMLDEDARRIHLSILLSILQSENT